MKCEWCGIIFPASRRTQRFDCPVCREAWHRQEKERQAELVSISAAAAEIGVSRYVIRYAIERGRLKAALIPTGGRPWRCITRGKLERFAEARRKAAQADS